MFYQGQIVQVAKGVKYHGGKKFIFDSVVGRGNNLALLKVPFKTNTFVVVDYFSVQNCNNIFEYSKGDMRFMGIMCSILGIGLGYLLAWLVCTL